MKFCIEFKKLSLKLKQHQRKSIFKRFFQSYFCRRRRWDSIFNQSCQNIRIPASLSTIFLQHDEMRKLANICDRETKIASAAKSNQSRV